MTDVLTTHVFKGSVGFYNRLFSFLSFRNIISRRSKYGLTDEGTAESLLFVEEEEGEEVPRLQRRLLHGEAG